MNQINIGDIYYIKTRLNGMRRLSVTRLTATQVVFGDSDVRAKRSDLENRTSAKVIGSSGWYVEMLEESTPELVNKYEIDTAKRSIRRYVESLDKHSKESLLAVLTAIKRNEK